MVVMLVSFVITGPGLIPEGGRLLSDNYIVTNEQDQVYMCFIHVFSVKCQNPRGSLSILGRVSKCAQIPRGLGTVTPGHTTSLVGGGHLEENKAGKEGVCVRYPEVRSILAF